MNTEPARAAPYVGEYIAAIERTEFYGLRAPPRFLLARDCVDPSCTMRVLLDYFGRHEPQELIDRTVEIYRALVPLLLDATGVPFQVTTGWIMRRGCALFWHDDATIARFLTEKHDARKREGFPFHLWLTSPACEILDVTFAMNLGWARSIEECAGRIIYQSIHESRGDPIYHPTLVGEDFFVRIGGAVVH